MRIFSESLRERKKSILAWMLGFVGFSALMIAFFDEFPDLSFYDEIIAQAPEIFAAFVGEITSLTTIEGFLSAELFSLVLPVMLAILGISLGTSLIAKEESAGTLELLLARPVSRARIFHEKALSLIVQLLIMVVTTWVSLILLTQVYGIEISSINLATTLAALMLLILNYSFLAMALSNILNRGIGLAVSSGLFLISYFITSLSTFIESLETFKDFSLFTYYRHFDSLTNGIDYFDLVVLLIPIVVLYWIAQAAFERRDIGV